MGYAKLSILGIATAVISIIGCNAAGEGQSTPKTPEDLGAAVYDALKSNDLDRFGFLLLTEEELLDVGKGMGEVDPAKLANMTDEHWKQFSNHYQTWRNKLIGEYQEILKMAEGASMDWASMSQGDVRATKSSAGKTIDCWKIDWIATSEVDGRRLRIQIKNACDTDRGIVIADDLLYKLE